MLTGREVAVLPERAGIEALRAALARTRQLLEIRRGDAGSEWTAVSPDVPFEWARERPLGGAKRIFCPPEETLLVWHDATPALAEPEAAPVALVGVHPCDLAAIAYQDRFFARDPWYMRRRSQAVLIGIDCTAACAGGFCHAVDAGPFARDGFDVALTPLVDGRVIATPGTPAGRALLDALGLALEPAAAALSAAYEAARAAAAASFPERPFVADAIARVDGGRVTHGEWHALGVSCFACTGCTNVCPTCSCFTVVDEGDATAGTRSRVWDSCLLAGFQREASGHTPAPHPGDRVRRFWSHKLEQHFAAACGRVGCVGCGRCDVTCPGAIGALGVMARLGSG
ncbi:MAG TPA: 4Fe-4S dicluster domain-containing protein [Candidatus Limnocylindria bacterium]|nr:4Fe-4S dicluster domain-containing protein [Candidatus Limnocylindria bacterium]